MSSFGSGNGAIEADARRGADDRPRGVGCDGRWNGAMDDRRFEPSSAARTAGIGSAKARCHTSDPLRVGRRAWRSPILVGRSLDEPAVVGDSVRAVSRYPGERHGVGDAPRRVRAPSPRRDALMVGRCAVRRGRARGFRPSDVGVVRRSITHLSPRPSACSGGISGLTTR